MHARRLVTLVVLVAATAVTLGAPPKPKSIDVKPVISKLSVFKDADGAYYVVPSPGMWDDLNDAENYLFFGDGKQMYQQRVIGFGAQPGSNGQELEWNMWSPRVKDARTAEMTSTPGVLELHCEEKGPRKLTPLHADEAKLFFSHAAFFTVFWQRQAQLLARDDDGVYYYVDRLRDEFGGKDFRVFSGMKGELKQLPMTNVVQDSGGEIYATKNGQLKIVANASPPGYWVKDGKKTELTMLDPADNRYLIYRELGIYGQLGVPCEDL
jgi:hypothetical protein